MWGLLILLCFFVPYGTCRGRGVALCRDGRPACGCQGLALCVFRSLLVLPGSWCVRPVLVIVSQVFSVVFYPLFFVVVVMAADVFGGYAQAARVISIVYLVIQVIVLIDAAYKAHEWLAVRIEKRDSALQQEYASIGMCQNGWCVAVAWSGCVGVVRKGVMPACPCAAAHTSQRVDVASGLWMWCLGRCVCV